MTSVPRPLAPGPAAAALLADIHAAAFPAPWTTPEFAALMDQPGVLALTAEGDGLILLRTVADEAEILTLAVRPPARRSGLGRALVSAATASAAAVGARSLFLEVAEDNIAALALYRGAGFTEAGRRAGYYRRPDGPAADALILVLNLP